MKKIFAVLAIFALALAGCDDDDTLNKFGEIGKTGPGGGIIFYAEGGQYKECSGELGNNTWDAAVVTARNYKGGGFTDWHLPDRGELDLMYKNLKQNDLGGFSDNYYWSSAEYSNTSAYYQYFYYGTQSSSGKSNSYSVRAVRAYNNDSVTPTTGSTFKIKNESSTDITDVIWQGVSFRNNQYENSIKTGTNVTATVQAGAGYIFFKRKSNLITARTSDMVIIEKNDQKEFVFTDSTVIVEVNNPANTGTLHDLPSTVIFWDDAEGEMQQYYLKQSFVGYYKDGSELLYNSTSNYINTPKNGVKSIAVGGTNTALLHIKINLDKNARLSFWYANKRSSSSTSSTTFSINSTEKMKLTTDIDWSFVVIDLEPGENNIVWEKKDGYGYNSSYYNSYYYLSLDDILIYYTE